MFTFFTKFYQYLVFYGAYLKSPLLLFCRLYWGWAFMSGALDKLLHIEKFQAFLANMHIIFPNFFAYFVSWTELIGGCCLFLGLASRLAAIPLSIVMIVAYFTAHFEALKALSVFVSEAPFNFLLTCLLVLAFGPGRFSIDYYLERWLFHKAQSVPTHQHLP